MFSLVIVTRTLLGLNVAGFRGDRSRKPESGELKCQWEVRCRQQFVKGGKAGSQGNCEHVHLSGQGTLFVEMSSQRYGAYREM